MKSIYLVLGEEKFAINKRIKRLIDESKADEFNITTYDLEVDSLDKALSDALTPPFMSDIKVVVLRNPVIFTKMYPKIDYSMLEDYLNRPMETTVLIIDANNISLDDKKSVVALIKKKAEIINVKKASDIEAFGWLKMQFNFAGIDIKEEAIRMFFKLIGSDDLYKAKNEVDKLINYTGRGGVINANDVKKLVTRNLETDVFKLTNAIIEKDKNKVFVIYNDLLKSGNNPVKLLGLVSTSMKKNYVVSLMLQNGLNQNQIATKLSVSSGHAFYLVKDARSFNIDVIKKYIIALGDLDYKIKSGKIDPKNGFESFLLNM